MSQLTFKEQASIVSATTAGEGAFWVKNDAPSTPVFTDDAGTDRTIGITLGTEQASTSGTSIDFTSIPSGVKRITIMFVDVSLSGTDDYLIQIGDSGGLEVTNYSGSGAYFNTTAQNATTSTSGFIIDSPGAGTTFSGTATLVLEDSSNFHWIYGFVGSSTNGSSVNVGSGDKALSAELDRVSVVTSGTDTFDSGSINIQYEF
jgi:hypothetical protein